MAREGIDRFNIGYVIDTHIGSDGLRTIYSNLFVCLSVCLSVSLLLVFKNVDVGGKRKRNIESQRLVQSIDTRVQCICTEM